MDQRDQRDQDQLDQLQEDLALATQRTQKLKKELALQQQVLADLTATKRKALETRIIELTKPRRAVEAHRLAWEKAHFAAEKAKKTQTRKRKRRKPEHDVTRLPPVTERLVDDNGLNYTPISTAPEKVYYMLSKAEADQMTQTLRENKESQPLLCLAADQVHSLRFFVSAAHGVLMWD